MACKPFEGRVLVVYTNCSPKASLQSVHTVVQHEESLSVKQNILHLSFAKNLNFYCLLAVVVNSLKGGEKTKNLANTRIFLDYFCRICFFLLSGVNHEAHFTDVKLFHPWIIQETFLKNKGTLL